MRYALAAIAFVVTAGGAQAQSTADIAACRDVKDSLLRLRCFDDVSKPAAQAAPSAGANTTKAKVPDFAAYAVAPYRGPIGLPDFRGRDRQHASYRTRILAGAKAGPNFAGHLALVPIGCGSSCVFVPVVDVQTGRVLDSPLGGEDMLSLDMKYQIDSRLIAARYISNERCKFEEIVWTGNAFQRGAVRDLGDREACWAEN
ncbi:hypothetical protein [Methylobacterium sp. yr668]|uniref:hypothetical protein n=1 Tax=Methylobacterium sp. yr668 TaxID=1761801 RepID=UPI0008E3C1B5|nr:hypothetical protein [Methylobacterium sp. yr668]SFT24711.1 hypothetical protein SAMN04487845_13053 [Methylobacterium sp. yr668]